MEVKRPGRETDHSLPFSAKVKECLELHLHYPNTPSWGVAQLINRKAHGQLYQVSEWEKFMLTSILLILGTPGCCYPVGTRALSLGEKQQGVKLTTHLHLRLHDMVLS
jgi:hypothetical protein